MPHFSQYSKTTAQYKYYGGYRSLIEDGEGTLQHETKMATSQLVTKTHLDERYIIVAGYRTDVGECAPRSQRWSGHVRVGARSGWSNV